MTEKQIFMTIIFSLLTCGLTGLYLLISSMGDYDPTNNNVVERLQKKIDKEKETERIRNIKSPYGNQRSGYCYWCGGSFKTRTGRKMHFKCGFYFLRYLARGG